MSSGKPNKSFDNSSTKPSKRMSANSIKNSVLSSLWFSHLYSFSLTLHYLETLHQQLTFCAISLPVFAEHIQIHWVSWPKRCKQEGFLHAVAIKRSINGFSLRLFFAFLERLKIMSLLQVLEVHYYLWIRNKILPTQELWFSSSRRLGSNLPYGIYNFLNHAFSPMDMGFHCLSFNLIITKEIRSIKI